MRKFRVKREGDARWQEVDAEGLAHAMVKAAELFATEPFHFGWFETVSQKRRICEKCGTPIKPGEKVVLMGCGKSRFNLCTSKACAPDASWDGPRIIVQEIPQILKDYWSATE